MTYTRLLIIAALLVAAALMCGGASPDSPQFNAKGELLFPADYREWVFLSSGLGMNYGPLAARPAEDPQFDNVFVAPVAYKGFLENGRWPDKTVLLTEVRASSSKGSINKAGHFQTDLIGIEAEVKDESRFPTRWAFFSFGRGAITGKQRPTTDACYSCHAEHGAVDNTFVQFYPTLARVAKAKGAMR